MNNRHDSWNHWQQQSQPQRQQFQQHRQQRWDNLYVARNNRRNWRNQNREDWQNHRRDMWDYRFDRADEVWDNCRDWYDDVFDDHWWGRCGWVGSGAYYGFGYYPRNPWWWWEPVTWTSLSGYLYTAPPLPVYPDYGMTVIYEDNAVYVDNKPVPVEQYSEPIIEAAASREQPSPPAPPEEGKEEDWLPLGVFALVQEEKGTPNMFMQLSINREGVITGGYQNTITGDERPLTGQVDKATQIAAWRIGDNRTTICTTSIANLTQDVCTLAMHFRGNRTETWLLVRLPEPSPEDQPAETPAINRTPPPLKSAATSMVVPPLIEPPKDGGKISSTSPIIHATSL